jgi:hypothetical protein
MTALATIPTVTRGYAGLRAVMNKPSAAILFWRRHAVLRSRNPSKSLEYAAARRPAIPMVMEIADMHRAATEAGTGNTVPPAARELALLGWLETARPGDRFVYHVGHLAADRSSAAGAQQELACVANRVMVLAAEGRVLLAQMRLADGRMAYLAIKATGRADRSVAR